MRIMQIASGGRTVNGALQYAVQLSRRLSARGHDVWMLCPDNSYASDAIADTAVRHIPSDLHRWPLDELRRIRDRIRSEGIEVMHGHSGPRLQLRRLPAEAVRRSLRSRQRTRTRSKCIGAWPIT